MTTPATSRPPRTVVHLRAAVAIGVVCALISAFVLIVPLRGALDDERAFRAAVACAPGGHGDDCLRTVTARVERTERKKGRRSASFWLYLDQVDGKSSRTRLRGGEYDYPGARPGGRVDVTYWRDQIRYVDFPGQRAYTTADPRGDWRLFCAWGLGVGLYGLGFLAVTAWWRRRHHISRRAYSWQFGTPLLGAVFLAGVGALAPWPTGSPGEAFLVVGAATPVVVAVCAVAVRVVRRGESGDDTVAVTPAFPAEQRVFPGVIVGEVPYARADGMLAAGPTGLATTPDPTGAALRREASPALTPVRARPPYRTDPEFPDYGGKALVLECEDEGVPVLVVTHRKHMRWVLGALRRPAGVP
ncbi:hypothetical protein SUDANB105_03583 [Streptomyces sp. enrichment culture]|uniref:hypothetical protein n=1 Tax=Streptomyces sp. enrichment culture TaxID=1795815 RepID=UPI003F5747C7